MAVTGTPALALLVSRVLFGGVLAFMGLNHFMSPEQMIPYAESKGVPQPKIAVYASGAALVLGGVAILVGVYATIGALILAGFFVVTTPLMHDFWAVPEDQKQEQMTDFLKNSVMLGATLGFAVLGTHSWAYAIGVGLV